MSLRLSGNNQLSYLGVEPLQPPNLVYIPRDPISGAVQNADYRNFNVGTLWLNPINATLWILVKKPNNTPLWIQLGITAAGFLQTLTADNAVAVTPVGLNINLLGDSNITTVGNNGTTTVQVTLNPNINVTSVTTTSLNVTGNATFGGNILTNLTRGVVQSPGGGGALFASEGTNGQVLISSSSGAPAWRTLTAGANVTITNGPNSITIASTGGGGTGLQQITGNTGVATPVGGNVNIVTTNTTAAFTNAGDTSTLNPLANANNNVLWGDAGLNLTSGTSNTGFGRLVLTSVNSGTNNVGMGEGALSDLQSGSGNTAIGVATLTSQVSGNANTAIGLSAGLNLTTGQQNTFVGFNSGANVTSTNDNIMIGNAGVVGDTSTLKIGTEGVQTQTYIAGVNGVTVSNQAMVVLDTVSGRWGTTGIPGGSGSSRTTFLTVGSGTFNKSLAPVAATIEVYGWQGGGGGGSGRRGASGAAGGGGGGAAGSAFYANVPGQFFGNTINYTVGAGGAGGAAQTVNNSDGIMGATGGVTSFGDLIQAVPASTGGGAGTNGTSSGGSATGVVISYNYSGNAIGAPGGSGTITVGTSGSNIAQNGIFNLLARPGGGGGGADTVTARAGGDGSSVVTPDLATVILAGGAGGIETGIINGSNGTDYTNSLNGRAVGGSGGGGGGGQSTGLVAGNGGNGGFPGGGGGGGGGSLNGTNSGAGGNGGDGLIIVIEHF